MDVLVSFTPRDPLFVSQIYLFIFRMYFVYVSRLFVYASGFFTYFLNFSHNAQTCNEYLTEDKEIIGILMVNLI